MSTTHRPSYIGRLAHQTEDAPDDQFSSARGIAVNGAVTATGYVSHTKTFFPATLNPALIKPLRILVRLLRALYHEVENARTSLAS
jgi:hypothetical protein